MESEKLKNEATSRGMDLWKRILLLLFTFHFSLFAYPCNVLSDTGTETNRLEVFLKGLVSFSAGFEQRLFNEYHVELDYSTGEMHLQRPDKFHWKYTEPYSQYLISNGDVLWIYDEDLEQVTISNIANGLEETPAAILTGNVNIEEKFIVAELGNSDSIDWIELVPKKPETQFDSIRLGFRDRELAAMVLFDNLGQITEITFTEPVRNPDLDESLFSFTEPEGVDIIDNRE